MGNKNLYGQLWLNNLVLFGFVSLYFVVFSFLFCSSSVLALTYSTPKRIEFKVNPTISLTVSDDSIYIPNLTPGTYADSNIVTVSASTNVNSGLKLYAAVNNGSSNSTSLTSNNGSSFTSISSTKATLADFSDNTWGYSYCASSCTTASNWKNGNKSSATTGYGGLPAYSASNISSGILMAESSNNTDQPSVQFKIGARAGSAQPAGLYGNSATFTAVTNVVTTSYTVSYSNPSGGASGLPSSATGTISSDSSITLSSTVPTRSGGYIFAGWCTSSATTPTDCTGNIYQPGDAYYIANVGGSVTINLYAVWQRSDPCAGSNANDLLYCKVASQSKGTQTAANLQTTISASNSGVYEYNSSVFGEAGDASNDFKIYYYRGILDSSFASTDSNGNIGSSGNGANYPNYVKLDDTCWRIVRTTGSGGVKMIYNGLYSSGAVTNTCANSLTYAQVAAAKYNDSSQTINGQSYTGLQYLNMHSVGYTYSSVAAGTTSATKLSVLLGSTGNDTTTNSNLSIIKQYVENTWFNNAIGDYWSMLESNAGYCNDRSVYPDGSYAISNKLSENTEVIPFGTSSMTVYRYGAYARNATGLQSPSLGCSRGIVDTYSTNTASGGNGQLSKPVALLTADEASFAGSGRSVASQGSTYNVSSYLRTGTSFWSFSPLFRYSNGYAGGFILTGGGVLDYNWVSGSLGVRPVISVNRGTIVSSGSGTAINPWVVEP